VRSPEAGRLPRSPIRRTTVSSRSAASSARFSRSTTGRGVPAGANSMFQPDIRISGSPASAVVGTSGRAAARSAVLMA
jgi:hypothetical protein